MNPRGRVLLDTNRVIDYLAGAPDIDRIISQASDVFLSAVVFGEMPYGALNSTHVERNVAIVRRLVDHFTILDCDQSTALTYAELKVALRKKGRPIPDNDLWIAATALQHGLTLATRDEHFSVVENLRTV